MNINLTNRILLSAAMFAIVAFGADAQVFDKGDRKMELTLGVGVVEKTDKTRATFDQHFTMEWGVAKFADKFTLGLGFAINNSYQPKEDMRATGVYDYTYQARTWGRTYSYQTKKWKSFDETQQRRRQGYGEADAKWSRDDVDALVTVSLHFSPTSKLDTYVRIGAGVGYMHFMQGDYTNYTGFKQEDYYNFSSSKIHESYWQWSYNDLAHADWGDSSSSKVVPAIAAYVGATYQLTDRWGIEAQAGLLNANLKGKKKGYPNSYGIFALGASYRF